MSHTIVNMQTCAQLSSPLPFCLEFVQHYEHLRYQVVTNLIHHQKQKVQLQMHLSHVLFTLEITECIWQWFLFVCITVWQLLPIDFWILALKRHFAPPLWLRSCFYIEKGLARNTVGLSGLYFHYVKLILFLLFWGSYSAFLELLRIIHSIAFMQHVNLIADEALIVAPCFWLVPHFFVSVALFLQFGGENSGCFLPWETERSVSWHLRHSLWLHCSTRLCPKMYQLKMFHFAHLHIVSKMNYLLRCCFFAVNLNQASRSYIQYRLIVNIVTYGPNDSNILSSKIWMYF